MLSVDSKTDIAHGEGFMAVNFWRPVLPMKGAALVQRSSQNSQVAGGP